MSITQVLLFTPKIFCTKEYSPSGNWGSNSTSSLPVPFTSGIYQGTFLTWGGIVSDTTNLFSIKQYSGYNTNFDGYSHAKPNMYSNIEYSGYNTNFNGKVARQDIIQDTDINSVIGNSKDEFIYYKIKGYNPITQTYETWIEVEDITSRPELFDPGRNPPTTERDINKLPPSGNALVNITIVARWIQ